MTTYYARSNLVTWDDSSSDGWSLSSGGANFAGPPTSSDNVVFDANSGSARSISCSSAVCNGLTLTGSATMTFTGGSITFDAGIVDIGLMGAASTCQILMSNICSLKTPSGASFSYIGFNSGGSLLSDLTCAGAISIGGAFSAGSYNVTAAAVTMGAVTAYDLGAGTWTLTGTGTILSTSPSSTYGGAHTISITDQSLTSKTIATWAGAFNNLRIASKGDLIIGSSSSFSSVIINAGSTLSISAGSTISVASFTADGYAGQITIKSSSAGIGSGLTKTGTSFATFDACTIKDISALPANCWRARNCTNVSNNTNINFSVVKPAFMAFL